MASVEDVLNVLKAKARPDQIEGMARFGMATIKRLGVSVLDMRKIATNALRELTSDEVQKRLKG